MKKFMLLLLLVLLFTNSANAETNDYCLINATITKNKIKKNIVVYNLSNAKLHTHNCEWAEKCTKNCIYIKKRNLKDIFFIPCVVCGGGVIEPASMLSDE